MISCYDCNIMMDILRYGPSMDRVYPFGIENNYDEYLSVFFDADDNTYHLGFDSSDTEEIPTVAGVAFRKEGIKDSIMVKQHTIKLVEGNISLLSYDDDEMGVYDEPFVHGTDEVLTMLGYKPGDNLTFGMTNYRDLIPDNATHIATFQSYENNGCWYCLDGETFQFWLCKHLYDYCKQAPQFIYLVK